MEFVSSSVTPVLVFGTDQLIVESARMSTGKGFQGWDKDHKFLTYLWKAGHTSPFEMPSLLVEVYCDIATARQWMRHRTFSYNEKSLRYAEHGDQFLDITAWRGQDTVNKQGSAGEVVEQSYATDYYRDACAQASAAYKQLLSQGVAREQARMVLPMSTMTRFRAKANLLNWIKFLKLRNHEHAQQEIRELAAECQQLIADRFPRTHEVVFGGEQSVPAQAS